MPTFSHPIPTLDWEVEHQFLMAWRVLGYGAVPLFTTLRRVTVAATRDVGLRHKLVLADATPIYGDNDRLPSGNLLASSWPSVVSEDAEFQYDVRYFETVRETKEVRLPCRACVRRASANRRTRRNAAALALWLRPR